tara:strand:- start:714 stop:872 length:159 start_codon:yes stop_codon:yes gene_type:complete
MIIMGECVFEGHEKKEYLLIEKKFMNFSERVNIGMDKFDFYFWYCETGEIFK